MEFHTSEELEKENTSMLVNKTEQEDHFKLLKLGSI